MKASAINFFRNHKSAQIFLTFVGLVALTALVGKIFPVFAGTILCLLLISGYYGVLFRCLKFCDINFLDELIKDFPRILLVAAVGTGFIIFMVSSQQTIYIWDSLETWEPTIYCEETTFSDPHQALKNLRGSINHADYNNFLPMLMALPMHIFGKSFLCYTLYVWLMFGLPAIFFAAALLKNLLEEVGFKNFPCSAFMAIFMLLPIIEIPIFVGYANISILLPGTIILAMLLSLNRAELQSERLILIGVLCIFAVFQARTAAYMILGIFFGYTLYVTLTSFQERNFLFNFLMLCKKFLVIGFSALLIMSPLFFTFIRRSLSYDIGTAYSAYQLGLDFSERFFVHVGFLGLLLYAILLVGVFLSFRDKKLFACSTFFLTWIFVSVFLICRIQLMDRQHYYIMILPFAMLVATTAVVTFSKNKYLGATLIFILTFNFFQSYLGNFGGKLSSVFTAGYTVPVRHDIDDLKVFVSDLNELTASNEKKIYLLASSGLYNSATLQAVYLPERHGALQSLMGTADVDLRDGFPTRFFDADFIIVSEPIQTHLRPQDQSVVAALSEGIMHSPPLSRHFKKIKEYSFSPDGISTVKFKLCEKISPYEKADIDFVENYFVELYPNQPELFKNRFEEYKREHFKE